jgi:3-hydroxyethyl bacteriochlorophyllide a dehydrogenase
MRSVAVVLEGPEQLALRELALTPPAPGDVTVQVEWTGISSGTERLLWSGKMPPFPGLGYPLVPGYETVGRVVDAGASSDVAIGDRVFVPGANCFGDVRGLFGGAASKLVVQAQRVAKLGDGIGEEGVLLALAATARHAIAHGTVLPDLIVGHGVLGRLLARISVALGGNPVVWETNEGRREGAVGYSAIDPTTDARRDYRAIYDVSGDASLVDGLLGRLARGGELVLAGFYDRISFAFPPAFMREARLRIAAEFKPDDLAAVIDLVAEGKLRLDGLISHRRRFDEAPDAYATAFRDTDCLKMLIDWRACP